MDWLDHDRQMIPATLRGVPPRFATATYDELPDSLVRTVVRDYLTAFWDAAGQGLAPIFIGPAATWKTYGASVIARAVHARGPLAVEFVSCADQFVHLPILELAERRETVRRWQRVPLLILDDFGLIEPDTHADAAFTAVVTSRFNALHPTIFTANFTLAPGKEWETLARRYAPSVVRRLRDGSEGFCAFTA